MPRRIFLAFANSSEHPLPTLSEEDEKLFAMLSKRAQKGHFEVYRDSNITTGELGHYLDQYRDEIIVFHYSGHAGSDLLLLEDKPAMDKGIVEFLSRCPHLRLVMLNGCSTQGQVEALLELSAKPAVIATHAPVGDHSATEFSITFYRCFCDQELNVEESFDTALSQVRLGKKEISVIRGAGSQMEKGRSNDPVWGLFYVSDIRKKWKLPADIEPIPTATFPPNSILIERLLTAFAPYYDEAQKVLDKGEDASKDEKIEAILTSLTRPVSQQLGKLIAPRRTDSEHRFFDRIGADRLEQIGVAYNTGVKLLAFILLSELWDFRLKTKTLSVSQKQTAQLKYFFNLSLGEWEGYRFPNLIELLRDILAQNKASLFVEEVANLPKLDQSSGELGAAVAYLENIRQVSPKTLSGAEIRQKCEKGEEMLAVLFSHLAFITRYSIRSVKSIDVQKYRHSLQPHFTHRVVKLIENFSRTLEENKDERLEIMYTASVCLMKTDSAGYLNLTPFVIDENAFDETAELAKLHYFAVYDKALNSFTFKHIYKPNENVLEIRAGEKTYRVITEQFNAFTQLLFNQPIQAL